MNLFIKRLLFKNLFLEINNFIRFHFFSKPVLLLRLLLLCLVIFQISDCKKKKIAEWNDEAWREESQKISVKICAKMEECAKDLLFRLEDRERDFAKKQLSSNACVEKHKKTNVYRLRGAEPEIIKTQYRSCYEFISTASCDQLVSGAMDQNESCKIIKSIQNQN